MTDSTPNQNLLSGIEELEEGFAVFDDRLRLVFCNALYPILRGYPAELCRHGTTLAQLFAYEAARGDYGDGDRAEQVADRIALIAEKLPQEVEQTLGDGRMLAARYRPLAGGGVAATCRDVTDLRRVEAASRAKSTFLTAVGHEIRTPVNGIIGTADLLEREDLTEPQKRLVRTVQASAAALLRLVDDVLDLAKIDAGRMVLEEAPFSLRGIVQESVETLSLQAERKGLEITSTIEPAVPDILIGDATRVRQILFNLLGNAIKFTDHGRVRIAVRAEIRDDGPVRVTLLVSDSGIGFGPDEVGRLFQPLGEADGSAAPRHRGTGLGLSIVRRLAELMGGKVSVESAPGKGSTFTVDLTFARSRAVSAEPAKSLLRAVGDAVTGTVLAVDDYDLNLEILARQFALLGVPLETASGGIEALTKWRAKSYALVFTDIHMPDMDAFELARQIRAEEALANTRRRTPIVALTANMLAGEADRCRAAGMDGYLTKPLTLDFLHQTVERWMGGTAADPSSGTRASRPGGGPIDRAFVAQTFGDNEFMIERVLARFAKAGGYLVAELVAASHKADALVDRAHRLKASARAAGAMRLGDLAAALEQSGDPADIGPLVREWQRVSDELSSPARKPAR